MNWLVELQCRQGGERQKVTFASMNEAIEFCAGTTWLIINYDLK